MRKRGVLGVAPATRARQRALLPNQSRASERSLSVSGRRRGRRRHTEDAIAPLVFCMSDIEVTR